MNKNFRLTNDIDELAQIISNIKNNGVEFKVWQNIDGEKFIIPGVLKSYIHKKDKLFIDFDITASDNIIEEEKLFLFCSKFNILVKGKIKHFSKTSLQIKVDKKFYLNEQRDLFRMDVEKKGIDLSIIKKLEHQNKAKALTVKLKDLCNGGCGFLVPSSRAGQFQCGTKISIEKVGSINLEDIINGQVAHITPIKANHGVNENLYLIGVRFDEIVPNIDHLLQMVEFGMIEIAK